MMSTFWRLWISVESDEDTVEQQYDWLLFWMLALRNPIFLAVIEVELDVYIPICIPSAVNSANLGLSASKVGSCTKIKWCW